MRMYDIVGERIGLVYANTEDGSLYAKWLQDKQSKDMLCLGHITTSIDSERLYISSQSENEKIFTIYHMKTSTPIGFTTIFNINHINKTCEIGIFIGEVSFRNKNYAYEAVSNLLEFIFYTLNMNNVLLRIMEDNKKGIQLAEKLGFSLIGKRRKAIIVARLLKDDIYYDITYNDYYNLKRNYNI